VPNLPSDDTEALEQDGNPLVFERNDFEELLKPQEAQPAVAEKTDSQISSSEAPVPLPSVVEPPPGAWGTHAEPAYDVEQIKPTSSGIIAAPIGRPAAVVISRQKFRLLIAAVGAAMIVAFGLGFLAGYLVK
jgi:hypothetical protein